MSRSIFGWDLPPGCRVSDIPGNRPEDTRWESIIETFFDKKRLMDKHRVGTSINETEYNLMDELYKDSKYSDVVDLYITMAIEYGMELGEKQAKINEEERKSEDAMYNDYLEIKKVASERDLIEYIPMLEV
jgi:hypothetical protein